MQIIDQNLGKMEVRTLALPDYVKEPSGTYTHTGTVFVDYKREGDSGDFLRMAVVNDDGTDFREIFAGEVNKHPKANGLRFMMFWDKKRVLIGDYVLECSPDIDYCESSKLIPVVYPSRLYEDKRVLFHWSEIIVSPDNNHICWTALSMGSAAVYIGSLVREDDSYVIKNVKVLSSSRPFAPDQNKEGYFTPLTLRGGEVKQFVRGGTAVSMVGSKNSVLPDSVVVDLNSEDILQVTRLPGYEETTIFSPDENLGIVMSTRGSPKTNCAIFGLVPRPSGISGAQGMILPVYKYAVAGVRQFRKGNVGPVLIEIDKSISDPAYMGVQLNDPEDNWVYLSPMSWHPGGKKAMWPEMKWGNYNEKRLRIVELLEYEPGEPILPVPVPKNIPYATEEIHEDWLMPHKPGTYKVAGKNTGTIVITREGLVVTTEYQRFSDDGKNFYEGFEKVTRSEDFELSYEAKFNLNNEKNETLGEMNCRLTFSPSGLSAENPVKPLFEPAEDGKPKSYGYAKYGEVSLYVDDMEK